MPTVSHLRTDATEDLIFSACHLKVQKALNIQPNSEALAAQFGDLLEYMPDAIVLVNSGGQIVLTTNMAEKLFG